MDKILIIEDDADILSLILSQQFELGYECDTASAGNEGVQRALGGDYILIVVDLALPDIDGFEVCRRIRAEKKDMPIVFLTSRGDESDKLTGFDLGADDYVTKPFGVRELISRIRAVLRRSRNRDVDQVTAGGILRFGPLEIDLPAERVRMNGEEVDIGKAELCLLSYMASHAGETFTREELAERAFGYQASQYAPTITVYLSRIRSRIEPNPADPRFIHTVRGAGYRFDDRG